MNVPVPEILEEIVEVQKPYDQEIPQENLVEQIADVPAGLHSSSNEGID